MAEYIEREALLSEFGEEPYVWNDDTWEIQANDDYKYYKELVEKASAVDVTHVVHGRWEKSQYSGYLVCSACRDVYVFDNWVDNKKWNYCPNCGAKMDGDE